ncbi:MAG: alpha/beta hydrolase, partial [Clostridia bacterium]|nr:alpha/beta hydrolase [Clostridia bacterium]
MFYGAKNGTVPIGDTEMDYLTFGTGSEALILIPGVGDGFQTARHMAIPFALLYRSFARRFTVYA